jgi:hypothetical protein
MIGKHSYTGNLSMTMSAKIRKSAGRTSELSQPAIDSFRGQHLNLAQCQIATELGRVSVTIDESKSCLLGWRAGAAAMAVP